MTIVEKAPHVLPPLDEEMAAFGKDELTRNGITVYTNQSAKAFKDNGKVIILENGSELLSDITIMSVGVQPESNLAKEAGLKLGMRGGFLLMSIIKPAIQIFTLLEMPLLSNKKSLVKMRLFL